MTWDAITSLLTFVFIGWFAWIVQDGKLRKRPNHMIGSKPTRRFIINRLKLSGCLGISRYPSSLFPASICSSGAIGAWPLVFTAESLELLEALSALTNTGTSLSWREVVKPTGEELCVECTRDMAWYEMITRIGREVSCGESARKLLKGWDDQRCDDYNE